MLWQTNTQQVNPFSEPRKIEVIYRSGNKSVAMSDLFDWKHDDNDPYDVMYYRVVGFAELTSDGSTASYYELPEGATELQDLISAKDMNAQIGEIFRECYRYGQVAHSPKLRGAKKIKFYIEAEIARLEKL